NGQQALIGYRFLLDPLRPFLRARLRLAFERCLLTVAAAIRFADLALRPPFDSDSLMCSYIRLFLAPFTPRGGMCRTSRGPESARTVLNTPGISRNPGSRSADRRAIAHIEREVFEHGG